jgi:transposase InsO family protein
MGQRELSAEERSEIYMNKLAGQSLQAIAQAKEISYHTARKWWRIGRDSGLQGLRIRPRGRPKRAAGSSFDPRVIAQALTLKRKHRRWGALRVLVALEQDADLAGLKLPSRSRLQAIFKEHCPDLVGNWTHHIKVPKPPTARAVHEVWQVDHQEGLALRDGNKATICNVRDPVGAAMIASQAFTVTTAKRWRKLAWEEVRQVLRGAFTEWQTLPDSVQTDNEMALGGNPNDPFPSWLTLWLAGLGIQHSFIRSHRPTDQGAVERCHRTMDAFSDGPDYRADLEALQLALAHERNQHNQHFPSRASDCAGRPPLTAHPELLHPRRPYQPEHELTLFDIQRVYALLANTELTRKVNRNGQITLKGKHYSIGLQFANQQVSVRLDPQTQEWVCFQPDPAGEQQEKVRRKLIGINVESLTGLPSSLVKGALPPIQLSMPLPPAS